MTREEESAWLRSTAAVVMEEKWGGRVWRLCAHAWLMARADRLDRGEEITR